MKVKLASIRTDRGACKLFSKRRISLLQDLLMVGTPAKPAPDLSKAEHSTDTHDSLYEEDFSEERLAKATFDIRLARSLDL